MMRRGEPYTYFFLPETPLEIRLRWIGLYLACFFLFVSGFYFICRPRSLELADGEDTLVYPPVAVVGFPIRISVHIPYRETCGKVWPQLESGTRYIRWIPDEISPSERGYSEEGAARTAFPVFEYSGVIQEMHASWEEILIQYSKKCETSDLHCRGQDKIKKRVKIYLLDLPLPPAFVQALVEGWKYLGVAWLLILSCMPAFLLLPNELREKILGAILR